MDFFVMLAFLVAIGIAAHRLGVSNGRQVLWAGMVGVTYVLLGAIGGIAVVAFGIWLASRPKTV